MYYLLIFIWCSCQGLNQSFKCLKGSGQTHCSLVLLLVPHSTLCHSYATVKLHRTEDVQLVLKTCCRKGEIQQHSFTVFIHVLCFLFFLKHSEFCHSQNKFMICVLRFVSYFILVWVLIKFNISIAIISLKPWKNIRTKCWNSNLGIPFWALLPTLCALKDTVVVNIRISLSTCQPPLLWHLHQSQTQFASVQELLLCTKSIPSRST